MRIAGSAARADNVGILFLRHLGRGRGAQRGRPFVATLRSGVTIGPSDRHSVATGGRLGTQPTLSGRGFKADQLAGRGRCGFCGLSGRLEAMVVSTVATLPRNIIVCSGQRVEEEESEAL